MNLERVAKTAAAARVAAHAEMAAGQKKGHWVWWVFPTLRARGGDANSAFEKGADLEDADAAVAYATHPRLRAQLLETLHVADAAFGKAAADDGQGQGPWRVLDKGFGRSADGVWIRGPVDAFKAFCSCTLFAAVGHRVGDAALQTASLRVLSHFTGDVVYTAGNKGSAGHMPGGQSARTVLEGHDEPTLTFFGGAPWSEISASSIETMKLSS